MSEKRRDNKGRILKTGESQIISIDDLIEKMK